MQAGERYIFTAPYLLQFLFYRDNCFMDFRLKKRTSRLDGLEKMRVSRILTSIFDFFLSEFVFNIRGGILRLIKAFSEPFRKLRNSNRNWTYFTFCITNREQISSFLYRYLDFLSQLLKVSQLQSCNRKLKCYPVYMRC